MPGLLDTFKQKATAVKDYLYPPAPNGMSLWEYAQQRANDPLQPNLSSRITQQDLINKGLNLAGLAPVGMVGRAKTKYEIAHDIASKNAEKMLGLPKGNTYIDRAKALGMDVDGFHGMPSEMRGKSFDRGMVAKNDYGAIGQGVYIDPSKDASYANAITQLLGSKQGSNIIPVKVRSGNVFDADALPAITSAERSAAVTKNLQDQGYDSVMSVVAGNPNEMVVFNPSSIRSRFAAFDPARIHEDDLLAGIAPYLGVGGLLGLGMYGNQDRMTD